MRHISCFSALTLIASAGIASADQAPDLPTGFYLVRETECSKATDAIIQYWDWERLTVLNPVAECQLTGLSRGGADHWTYRTSCREHGYDGGSFGDMSKLWVLGPKSMETRTRNWVGEWQYCPQESLPEPWRSKGVSAFGN